MHSVFSEFSLLLMIAYIVVGILVGPSVPGLVTAHDQIDLLAQVGVTVLLFVVGLKLDLQHIRHIGPVALATGLGQLAFTIVFGFVLILLMGKSPMEALYVLVALTFSSTIIIVKLLSDKREIDSLHGRIAVGFLIVQDLAVVLAMMVMSAMRGDGDAALAELALSTYMILYSHPRYEFLAPLLRVFERRHPHRELGADHDHHYGEHPDVMVFGLGRYGSQLALGLKAAGLRVVGVDLDPEAACAASRKGFPVRFGDGMEADFVESLPLKNTAWIVSALPDLQSNRELLRVLREQRYDGGLAIVAREEFDHAALRKPGVAHVPYPMSNAVDYAVGTLTKLIRQREIRT